jgi:hypothetical protein
MLTTPEAGPLLVLVNLGQFPPSPSVSTRSNLHFIQFSQSNDRQYPTSLSLHPQLYDFNYSIRVACSLR